jgi:ATP-binding cassette subfamily F protein 3
MIQFDAVSLAYGGQLLFRDASFSLQRGERCGLIGRNGSGKTTLFRLIAGQVEPDSGVISLPKHYRLGYLEQHIRFTEPTLLQEAASQLPIEEQDNIYRAEKILFGLGFGREDMQTPPERFSGGYQLRLHLAKVLVSEPDCLLLDEPTNYLDIVSIRWLSRFLRQWQREFILISHDRAFMDAVTTHTLGIHRQRVQKIQGSSLDYAEHILFQEETHEKTRVKLEKKREHAQSYIDRFGAKASKAAQAQARQKMLEKMPILEQLKELQGLSFSFHEAPFPGKIMLKADRLSFSYTASPLIQEVSLSIDKGARIAIIGKNGRGKSTLLRLLAQDLLPRSGSLALSENTRIGYFGQTHIDRLRAERTIEEEIASANRSLTITETRSIAGLMLFGGALAAKKIAVLSGGERSRVLLGTLLAAPCNLLLLDEPTHHLDMESIEALTDALERFQGAVVIVTHSEEILRRLSLDALIVCNKERQRLFLGDYDQFLEKEGWEEENAPKKKKPSAPSAAPRPVSAPLKKEIAACEERIILLEAEQEKELLALQAGDHRLAGSVGRRQQEIDALYERLQELVNLGR